MLAYLRHCSPPLLTTHTNCYGSGVDVLCPTLTISSTFYDLTHNSRNFFRRSPNIFSSSSCRRRFCCRLAFLNRVAAFFIRLMLRRSWRVSQPSSCDCFQRRRLRRGIEITVDSGSSQGSTQNPSRSCSHPRRAYVLSCSVTPRGKSRTGKSLGGTPFHVHDGGDDAHDRVEVLAEV